MAKTQYDVVYRISNHGKKDYTTTVEASTERTARKAFQTENPTAVIKTIAPREDWTGKTIIDVGAIIDEAERMRNAYFWGSQGSAAQRRAYEDRHSWPEIEWTEGGHTYSAEFCVRCSCQNIYARGYYYRDGDKTTLTAIRKSYERMRAQDEAQDAARKAI